MAAKERICQSCGTTGKTRTETPGSIFIEIILWFCFLVPGMIYTIWRHTKKHQVCPACGSAAVIPADSPAGRELSMKFATK